MKYVTIMAIWLSYAGAVTAMAYWSGNPGGIFATVLFGGFFAVISTAIVAKSN